VFCALHNQLASVGRHAQLMRCFSAVAELPVFTLLAKVYPGKNTFCHGKNSTLACVNIRLNIRCEHFSLLALYHVIFEE